MVQTVGEFLTDAYQLVSANSPTIPLQGSDMSKAVQFFNQLVSFYGTSSLLLPIAQKISFTLVTGQQFATFAAADYLPTPTVGIGRLTNLDRAWLNLSGVDYPLINEDRGVFFGSYKYFPQQGLPRFVIVTNDLDVTTLQFYPAPSQNFTVFIYGKFAFPTVTKDSLMNIFPEYIKRFFNFAMARELAFYKGRSSAWTEKLEAMYQEAKDQIESVSTVDLVIDSANESYLNGSWRVRAGV